MVLDEYTGWGLPTFLMLGFLAGLTVFMLFEHAVIPTLGILGLWGESPTLAAERPYGASSPFSPLLWAGLWGALLVPVLVRVGDVLLWPLAAVAGAVVPALSSWLIDQAQAGMPLSPAPRSTPELVSLATDAVWALTVAALLQLVRTIASIVYSIKGGLL
jgi:hypothetical protein